MNGDGKGCARIATYAVIVGPTTIVIERKSLRGELLRQGTASHVERLNKRKTVNGIYLSELES